MSISSRITEMEQHIGNAYDKIEDLGIDLTDVDKNINNISSMLENVWNEYPKVTATDVEEASINGTKKGRMEIDLKGQTSQATTILPLEYQQVEYIQSSGVEYIDSGYQLNSNTSKIIIKSKTINGLNKFRCLFGYENAYTNRFFLRFSTDNSGFLYAPNNYTINNMQIDNINNIEIDISNNKTKCNGIETATSININNSSLPLFIFTLNYKGSPASDNFLTMQLYTFQVYENNNIVRNLIPCYRKSDNEIGLYDLVTKTFLTNQGTGTFTKGNDVTIPNPDFPQPIKNVTGNSNVKIQNKNLLNIADGNTLITKSFDITDFVEVGKTYSFSAYLDLKNTTSTAQARLRIDKYIGTEVSYLGGTLIANKSKGISKRENVTLESSVTKVVLTIQSYGVADFNCDYSQIMLEQGTTATSYVEHQEQNYPFTFAEGQRAMQGTTLEDDGIHQKRRQTTLGNVSALQSATLFGVPCKFGGFTLYNSKNSGRNYNFKCNKVSPANETYGQYKGYRNGYNFVVMTDVNDTLENFNSKISGSIIEYEVEHEEIIPYQGVQQVQYNAIKQARSYDDQTNISQTNDELPFILDIETLKNN